MSTRATYRIDGHTFYIHHDGYPTGAASYFYNMLTHENARGGHAERFIRGNENAEFTGGHDAHGDTQYRYTLEKGHLTAYERLFDRSPGDSKWRCFFVGGLDEFINARPDLIENFSHVVRRPETKPNDYTHVCMAQYETRAQIEATIVKKLDEATTRLDQGHIGNASGTFNEVWTLCLVYEQDAGERSEIVKNARKATLDADPRFVEAYANGWTLDAWRKSFRPGLG